MRREKPPPVQAPLLDENGNLTPQWVRWFQIIGKHFDSFRRTPDLVYTASAALTTDDFGKMIVFNNGVANVVCTLPTVTSRDTHCWLGPIYRLGTGELTIQADTASRIESSSVGGSIMCNEVKRKAANVTLELVSDNMWAIVGATGIWRVS